MSTKGGGMDIKRLTAFAQAHGVDLDEAVESCLSLQASHINNSGVEEQIKYLVEQYDEETVADMIGAD